jgi:hypothetical protein
MDCFVAGETVIPGPAKREPGIHNHGAELWAIEIETMNTEG